MKDDIRTIIENVLGDSITADQVDEILILLDEKDTPLSTKHDQVGTQDTEIALKQRLEDEKDPLKKAAIAARIISLNL